MATLKVKMNADFICPECGRTLYKTDYKKDQLLTCFKAGCPNENKYFEMPEIEVKEYENRDGKKQD